MVKVWGDDGMGGGFCYGIVVAAGAKMATIRWESGSTNRVRHTEPRGVEPIRADEVRFVSETLKRAGLLIEAPTQEAYDPR